MGVHWMGMKEQLTRKRQKPVESRVPLQTLSFKEDTDLVCSSLDLAAPKMGLCL
jgi:hypothetical protein